MAESPTAKHDVTRPRTPGASKGSLAIRPAAERTAVPDAAAFQRHEASEKEALEELRTLLVTPEQEEIQRLRRRIKQLERPTQLAVEQVSGLLPEAIVTRSRQDAQLAKALAPTIEETLKVSVERNPQPLVNAIFPVIGPAIRRSINEALSSITNSVNRALEHSFSLKSLKWRLEARRTGTSFAEVVLSHTLLYQVEQIFLIDRETGLPLQHVTADAVTLPDDDEDGQLFSAMLTAIQDFVRDSLGTDEEETLATMQVGDRAVWIEPGPQAYLAAVIRGVPDPAVRDVLKEIIETVHLELAPTLADDVTDPEAYEGARPLLEAGLLAQYKEREKKRSPFMWLLLLLVLAALGAWIYFGVRSYQRGQLWEAYLDELRAEPGIVVTEHEYGGGRYVVQGLRDPLAARPTSLPGFARLPDGSIEGHWESYQALDPAIVEQRARRLLDAPESVTLRYEDGMLSATGSASTAWIEAAREQIRFLPGVDAFDMASLESEERARLQALTEQVERMRFAFGTGSPDIDAGQNEGLDNLAAQVQNIRTLAEAVGQPVRLRIIGHASSEGTAVFNARVSRRRALGVRAALIERGVPASFLLTEGSTELLREEATPADRAFNRSVTFEVVPEAS